MTGISGLFEGTIGDKMAKGTYSVTWETDEKTGRKRCSACKSCYIEDEWTGGEWQYCPVCGAWMKDKA